MYYLRSRPAADAIKFTVDQEFLTKKASFHPKSQLEKSQAEKDIDGIGKSLSDKASIQKSFVEIKEDNDEQMKWS